MSAVNQFDSWTSIRELIGDLVGRTESNAGVFDLIKTIRSDVARDRQQFREAVPKIMASKFSRKLTDDEWTSLYKWAKADPAALDHQFGRENVLKLLHDDAYRQEVIDALKEQLQTRDPAHWPLLEEKMNQLANFMNTGRAGRNLLRNADAVANLLGEKTQKNRATPDKAFVSAVDKLTSLYALEKLAQNHKDTLASLAKDEHEGVHFALSYLVGQRKDEMDKTDAPRARFNYYKGHIASLNQNGRSLIVANDNRYNELLQRGYKRVGDYVGSAAEGSAQNRGYYYAPVSARASFNQGLIQNVRHTAYGVEALSGFTDGITAGRIADPESVNHISKVLAREGKSTLENLLPVYDADGRIAAYERSVDPDQLLKMNPDTHLGRMTGVWRGRQVEEAKAQVFNRMVIDTLHAMYKKDMQESSGNKTQYVDMLDAKALARDPTLRDAASLLSQEAIDYAHSKYGADALYVRRDMLNDAVGVRKATIGDAWTGNTRWSPEIQLQVRNLATAAMGNNAYRFLVGTEQEIQSVVRDAKSLIVVKSIIVPWANFVGNIYSLLNRGIPITHIVRSMPNKMAEVHTYTQGRLKEIQLEADLRAASGDVVRERILGAEIQSLQDSYRRMSIWPLLEAGELSAISTHGIDRGDIELTGGRLAAFIKAAIEKLPSSLQTAGRYALITKETALYQALAKSVEWGDFMAKAIMYDDLTKRKNLSRADAMGKVTEEFVNYDRMPGRFREYLESMGMLWFYNFKIRATKVAVSTIRNNPVHALLTTLVPALPFFPSAGTPLTDNLFTKGAKGVLSYSTGPQMMLHAPMLNPWVEVAHWAYKAF
jgi:hypothetical protein